jgi:ribonuclease Z
MLAVTILGNNSALSMHDRHQTSQVVTTDDQLFLVDCGESTQLQMQRYKIRKSKINHIFISHLHGDHYYGLPGLLNTYSLTNRIEALHVYATPELKEVIDLQLKVASSSFSFEFIFHPITEAGTLLDLAGITVSCFAVTHRIPCWGFIFKEKEKPRKINIEKINQLNVSTDDFKALKEGKDIVNDFGEIIKNEMITLEGPRALAYAFCADTRYDESIIPHIMNADLIYHEATYLDDQLEKAVHRFHSTSSQAATIAEKSGAKKLLLGHFSSKYDNLQLFETEARTIFKNTEVSKEGVSYIVK